MPTISINIAPTGTVEVCETTILAGGECQRNYNCFPPGSDVTGQTQEVIDAAATAWTPEVIAAYLVLTAVPELTLEEQVSNALVEIDADTDAIYGAVLGNRGPEYLDAEFAAQAFKDAGYIGIVPEDVQSYATAMGWTEQQAADDILLTAANWRPAKHAIRANRLAAKEAVRDSLAISEVEAVLAWWAVFVAAIRAQLGI